MSSIFHACIQCVAWEPLLDRVTLVRGAAAYSARGRSVGLCVGLSSELWKNGGSDPDAVWHHRSDGSRDEAGSGVWGWSAGRVLLGANLGRTIVTNGDLTASVCDSASTVRAAVWGGACGGPRHCCIRWGSTLCKGKGRFCWFFLPIFSMGNAIGS